MRAVTGTLLMLAVVSVMSLMFYGLWQNEHQSGPPNVPKPHRFPEQGEVARIVVYPHDGSAAKRAIHDPATIAGILRSLSAAPQDSFGDPELSGARFRVEMRRVDAPITFFEINDLRGTGSHIAGKIYSENPAREDVWTLSPDLIRNLLEGE